MPTKSLSAGGSVFPRYIGHGCVKIARIRFNIMEVDERRIVRVCWVPEVDFLHGEVVAVIGWTTTGTPSSTSPRT